MNNIKKEFASMSEEEYLNERFNNKAKPKLAPELETVKVILEIGGELTTWWLGIGDKEEIAQFKKDLNKAIINNKIWN